MAAPKGHPRYGGRKKGTPNKRTADFDGRYDELVKKHGDPLIVMFQLLDEGEAAIRLQAAKELLSYRYAKRRDVQISGPDGGPVNVNTQAAENFVREFKETIEEYSRERAKG